MARFIDDVLPGIDMKRGFSMGLMSGLHAGAGPSEADMQLPSGIAVYEGLVYSRADVDLMMDLLLPQRSAKPVPCVIVIEGGGFRAQGGMRFRHFAEYLAENAFAAALITYRGRPDHTCRDTIADTKAAVRYVRRISGEHDIDPSRIGAMGRSAGGTLTALLAVTGGMREFEGEGGHSEFSSRIQAGVGYAGVYDFVARFTDKRQIAMQPGVDARIESNSEWIGEAFSPTNQHWRNVSAIHYIDETTPPMLLIHCKDDSIVPWMQSRDMHARLREVGVHSEVEYYEDGGHGFQTRDPREPMARMLTFFKKALVEQPAASDGEDGAAEP